ncbi:ornithine carbamoyltransferase [Paenibacillus sp.]|uniref:ornithine carbamoyltransferase n=1 Tax=Paenibacillus sp. TaxID=58172 RepID=UPI002811B42D|nr:ornithine carbamoyltransferase [Paenibacillus sp.]
MLEKAGYSLSPTILRDVIVGYCLQRGVYDFVEIEETLADRDVQSLINDRRGLDNMHFIDLLHFTSGHIQEIYTIADTLKANPGGKPLEGKTFVLFFPQTSLRTRTTFQSGIRQLGGDCILFPPETLDRREELIDTVKYLENWADGIVVRHPDAAKVRLLAEHASIPVINAMTNENHPCEVVADLYALRQRREDYLDLVYTYVGPIGNIFKAWADLAEVMNLRFHHVCTPENEYREPSTNYRFHSALVDILPKSDVILTDSLPASYQNSKYIDAYQITFEKLHTAKPGAMLNPCPPFFRSEEVSHDAIESEYFVGHGFKKDLLLVQQAILVYCSFGGL